MRQYSLAKFDRIIDLRGNWQCSRVSPSHRAAGSASKHSAGSRSFELSTGVLRVLEMS